MAKPKYDIVVQAARYDDDGQILSVQAYKRVGHVWSDQVLIGRQDLVEQLKSGKRVVIGERISFYGSEFRTTSRVKLISVDGQDIIVSEDFQPLSDQLQGVPIF